jgi:thiamine biosynthesis lipoprotein
VLKCNNKNSGLSSLFLFLPLAVLLILSLSGCQQPNPNQSVTFSGPIMGTDYRVTVIIPSSFDLDSLETEIVEELNEVNSRMSTYLTDSELSKLNNLGANIQFPISESLHYVLSEALEISKLTDGAFDVTVADAVNIWGFGPDGAITSQPSEQQLLSLRESVGYQNIQLSSHGVSKRHAATKVDLSAIAKGYAVDRLAQLLKSKPLNNFLIDVGGELRAAGRNAENQDWRIAIEKPQNIGGVQQIIGLSNVAIATSGDYRNYLIIDGQRFSHTIDPQTLKPAFHRLALASVIAEKASTADSLATALMVMGEEAGLQFAIQHDLAAYFIIRELEGDAYSIAYTDKFAAYLR